MSTLSGFKNLGNTISGALKGAEESRNLETILSQIQQNQTPQNIGSILQNFSPERQQAIQGAIAQKGYENIATDLETQNPDSTLHKSLANIYRSPLPIDQKEKLVKAITSAIPYRAEQQQRLQMDSVLKRYNSRIKELDAQILKARYSQKPPLEAQRKALQDERDYLLNFNALNQPKDSEKIKFEIDNPEHMKIFEQLDEQFGGDKDKVNEALNERFTL